MSDIAKGGQLQVYAPSLRSLPEGSLLVMATLPILDWNDCLLRDLLTLDKATSAPHVYAAILMIDPFACWEDIAELLKDAGITGVANFPPASMIERSAAGVPVDAGQELELRRMEWSQALVSRRCLPSRAILKLPQRRSDLAPIWTGSSIYQKRLLHGR
ncbi:hypothetical protein [Bradyrhizobium sp. BR 1432]|uniref:hypothetical protein n=1 Tax=Bradyrhizobium sp. BR 1432 TaxID=3447966 RepID=UPI003EE654C4